MVFRKPHVVGVLGEFVESQRRRRAGDRAEHAATPRGVAHLRGQVGVDPDVEELDEGSVLPEDAECAVSRIREIHRRLDGGPEDGRQIGLAGHGGGTLHHVGESARRELCVDHGGRISRISRSAELGTLVGDRRA